MRLIERRVGLVFALFLAGLALAGTKALWLGVVKASTLKGAATVQQEATVTIPARRGAIIDRNGDALAVSEPATTVAATPYLIRDKLGVARRISGWLHRDQDDVLTDLNRHTGFVYLARKLPIEDAKAIEKMHIDGLDFIDDSTRQYPRSFLASQLLGFTGTDNTGLAGLEEDYDKQLRGHDGRRRLTKDALGQPIKLDDEREPVQGENLKLTIDDRIQDKTEQVLAEVGAKYRPAKGATAIVMNPRTGELLAVANWPRVDNNRVMDAPAWARQDRAVQTSYEPGSTFKAFTMAGALEDGKVTPETMFDLPARIQVADRSIGEAEGESYGYKSASDILKVSSNVGMIKIGLRLGAARFDQWVRRFGFGKTTGVDLPGEQTGIVLPLSKYSGSSMGNLPIGQGEAVTPMQMATAYAAIANGGILRSPRIVKAVGNYQTPTPPGHRVISTRVSQQLRTMLEGVLGPGGTASGAAIKGYVMAGKTGTAEKPDPITGGYSTTKYVASFVGFAPAQNPKLLTLVMVDEPEGDIYGGSVAAPAWRDIMSFSLNYLGIPPERMIGLAAAIAAASCPIFPSSFSTDRPVTGLPVARDSAAIIARLSPSTGIHPDFGTQYGIPFDRVGSKTPRSRVSFDYADESDRVRYPIPKHVHIEPGGGDRHALLIDRSACRLYELYALQRTGSGWHAGSGAVWNLRSKRLRPKGWTSADAAGLPIFPLLARWDEARHGVIRHALRVTFAQTRNRYVYPARHEASSRSDADLPRMGERLRLRKSFDVRRLHGQARVIARTMQTYGLIVADNGSNWYVTGAPSKHWNDDVLHTLDQVHGSDFDVVDASSLK